MTDPDEEWHQLAADPSASDPYDVLRKWERLRLLYNVILIPFVVVVTLLFRTRQFGDAGYWTSVAFGGVISNGCFCLGPVLEFYLVRLGADARTARGWLFALGTAFTALAALATVVLYGLPDK